MNLQLSAIDSVVNAKALSIMRYQDDIPLNTEHYMMSMTLAALLKDNAPDS